MKTLEESSQELQEALIRLRKAKQEYLESLFMSVAFKKFGDNGEKARMTTYITELE